MNNGIPVKLDKAITELRKYRHGLKTMGGGFTLSGGEPLMQDRFAVRLLRAAQEMGIHTALDTNGILGQRLSDPELHFIDLILLDIKCWNPEVHRRLTGMDLAPVLEFARRLAACGRRVWLRYVLVPGVTDNISDIAQIAKFVAQLGNVQRVDVLPFHQMGKFKWKELKLDYTLEDVKPPAAEVIQIVCEQFRVRGLNAF